MDVSKYRTRFPPREHEEAVRMLLEGLDQKTSEPGKKMASTSDRPKSEKDLNKQQDHVSRSSNNNNNNSNNNNHRVRHPHEEEVVSSSIDSGSLARCSVDEDEELEFVHQNQHDNKNDDHDIGGELEFLSDESSSLDHIQVSPQIASKHAHHQQRLQATHQSDRLESLNKLTNRRLVEEQMGEHRRRHTASAYLPRMQSKGTSTASESLSVSSNNGGLRREFPASLDESAETVPSRTIAIQCDLKVSSVKRDGLLVTDSASTDLASMQASSISSTRYGFYRLDPELLAQRRLLARSISSRNIAHQSSEGEDEIADDKRRVYSNEAPASLVSSEASCEPVAGDHELELVHRAGQQGRVSALEVDEVDEEEQRGQRTQSSYVGKLEMPRRPKTALSYVSSSRLRERCDASLGSLSEPEEDETRPSQMGAVQTRQLAASRAMSHQALAASRPKARDHIGTMSSSNSDSELGGQDRFRVPHREEILITRRGQTLPQQTPPSVPDSSYASRRSRPASAANQTPRRSQTLTNGLDEMQTLSRRLTSSRQTNRLEEPLQAGRSIQKSRAKFAEGTSSPPFRSAAGASSNNTRSSDEEPRKLARYGLMSQSVGRTRASCNLISSQLKHPTATRNANEPLPTTGVARHMDSVQKLGMRPATLARTNHPASQQVLSKGRLLASVSDSKPCDKLAGASAFRRPRTSPQATGESLQPIGRSTSMKHVNGTFGARLMQSSKVNPDRQQRRFYSSDCDSSCCEQVDCSPVINRRRRPATSAGNYADYAASDSDQKLQEAPAKRSESEDSESPGTRTWANPSSSGRLSRGETSARSYSVRDVSAMPPGAKYKQGEEDDEENDYAAERGEYRLEPTGDNRRRFERLYRARQVDDDAEGLRYHQQQQQYEESDELELNSAASSSFDGHQQTEGSPLTRAASAHHKSSLDFHSQQRLNEIGLPVEEAVSQQHKQQQQATATLGRRQMRAPHSPASSSSHLGLSSTGAFVANSTRYATTGRRAGGQHADPPAIITGRAMSQQSLTRPSMPLSRRLRRSGTATSGSQSGASEVGGGGGGSSLSLASRLRYENAHTRTPVVMYIPQALPKASSSEHIRRVGAGSNSLLRKSSRLTAALSSATSRSRHPSQERAGRKGSVSRQTSDSEASSSSMLRTLVKPRANGTHLGRAPSGRRLTTARSRRGLGEPSDEEENLDGIGQLATEIDSYKFRRRYSVPKDAKINWFSKLKQRVSSRG